MNKCAEHSGHEARIKNLEEAKEEMTHTIETAHRRIDGMKNWVIAGMTSLVIQLILAVFGIVIIWAKSKGGP